MNDVKHSLHAARSQSSLPASLWAATASPCPALEQLTGHRTVDVAIIGAGYTGLSTALHLAVAGVDCAVIDTHEPSWGASGRNGGQVLPGLKVAKAALQRRFGEDIGNRVHKLCETAAQFLYDLVEEHGIGCDLARTGSIRAAHNRAMLAMLRENFAALVAEGVPARFLGADDIARSLGTRAYLGGRFDPRSGTLHPLKYARGLAAAALRKGAMIYRDSPATALSGKGGRWHVTTPDGVLVARQVVVATNGYTDRLWPRLAATMLPVHSFQIATARLSGDATASILQDRVCFSDTRRLILYAQRSADDRLVLGGRASFTLVDRAADYKVLHRVLVGLFPQLRATPIEYRWAGRVALTRDSIPHLHAPAPGILIATGFNGKGVAMTTLMGKILADHIRFPDEPSAYPITEIRPIPLYFVREPALNLAMYYETLMDRLGR
ncbi:MAG TPA: FAD-dependent oxidoreductase [Stellaceae bacterium]|nr:FAD-dependent oxidoreductase [Stellaceae bacterium]